MTDADKQSVRLLAGVINNRKRANSAFDQQRAADMMLCLLTEIERLEAKNAGLKEALRLAIGLGCDLGMTEMEVDAIKERATPPA